MTTGRGLSDNGLVARMSHPLERDGPHTGKDLDAKTQAANRAREPPSPPARNPWRQERGENEDVKRVLRSL
jgi:hypothetical protein